MISMLTMLRKLDCAISQRCALFFLLLFLLVLRLPNFVEPYWYGDEGIYLTIGTAMRQGERLYADIVDHKTPLIYYFAMTPTQLLFRIENVAMMMLTTAMFFFFAKKIFRNSWAVNFATLFFIIFTTLPWFEGNIPNGELFVMFFVFLGGTFFSHTQIFRSFFASDEITSKPILARHSSSTQRVATSRSVHERSYLPLIFAGLSFSLAVLTKVPGIFDVFGFCSICWFVFVQAFFAKQKVGKKEKLMTILLSTGVLVGSLLIPILFSILYYILRGSGKAYLDFGLLYNFRYAANWALPFTQPALVRLFSLPGKAGLVAFFMVVLTFSPWLFSQRFRFLAAWFGLALFATLLSNRPYPHYFLQTMPPLSLLFGNVLLWFSTIWQGLHRSQKNMHLQTVHMKAKFLELPATIFFGGVFIAVLMLLHVGLYETSGYYLRFAQLVTHQISQTEYRDSFNELMADNYAAATIIRACGESKMFIWGTNPMLYALSQKAPTGRFTVAFHIFDFNAMGESLDSVEKYAPKFVVVMNDERPFPDLNSYLNLRYVPNYHFQHFVLWKRL
jgi:hypothetical protein